VLTFFTSLHFNDVSTDSTKYKDVDDKVIIEYEGSSWWERNWQGKTCLAVTLSNRNSTRNDLRLNLGHHGGKRGINGYGTALNTFYNSSGQTEISGRFHNPAGLPAQTDTRPECARCLIKAEYVQT
jgi:hypothetical protein